MKSNYSQLGKYIREIDIRNSDLAITNLLGVSMEKTFIPSVANLNGVDLSIYKVLKRGQLACKLMSVGRDKKLPVDLYLDEKPAIISSAYYVFEPKNNEELLPEYLILWLCRPENDRYIGFISGGDVRGGISWETFCSLPIKVPSIEKQREIVEEYNTIQNRITLNQNLIQKLESTAQAIYKEWFVDGIDKENLPEGWRVGKLSDIATIIMGQSPEGETYNKEGNGMIFYQGRTDFGYRFPEITTYTTQPKKKAIKNDILISVRAPVGDLNIAIENCAIGRGLGALRSKFKCNSHLFYTLQNLKSHFDISDGEGTIFGSITKDDLHNIEVIYSETKMLKFEKLAQPIDITIKNYSIQNKKLNEMKELLLSKMTKGENFK